MTSASDELELPADERSVVELRTRGEGKPAEEIEDGSRGPLIAPVMARAIVAIVFAGFCADALIFVISAGSSRNLITLGVGYLIVLLTLQAFYFSRPGVNLRSPLTYALLAVQAALVYLPLLQFDQSWVGLPGLLAGTVLLVLRPPVSWIVFGAILTSMAVVQNQLSHSGLDVAYTTVGIATFAMATYGLTRLAGLITELHTARSELATTAVAHERLRFARDLHDLLGLSLSAIAPKGELAYRLVSKNPDRARQELSEVLDISRRALADVRAVAHGYRELNLDEESRTAESVLAASRVDVRMELKHGELPVHIRTLLAAVLREGVANVLEHSDAERCEVIMRQVNATVSLDVVNDGVDESAARAGPYEGSRLTSLSERVTGLGGRLSAGLDADGRFRLQMTVPVTQGKLEGSEVASGEHIPRFVGQLARALVAVAFGGSFVLAGLHLAYRTDDTVAIAVSVGYLLLLLLLQLFYFSRHTTQLRPPTSYALLVVQACLVYLPLLQFDIPLLALPGFLAGSALLVLRPVAGWTTFAAIVASAGWVQAVHSGLPLDIVFNVVNVVINGLIVYGLTWMARSVSELRRARTQLAQVAVAEERLRFARDLHDLLGLSLSAVTLKSELAHRLVTAAPDRAREELSEILGIARLALADVRLVASGYRELSLSEEFETAESLLAAAEVDVRMSVNYGELPAQVGTLLATVLREGVTNVLRHSKGERCEITVRQQNHTVCMEIINDGVTQAPATSSNGSGSGIHNLSYRVALLGGELTAGLEPDGRFRLLAKVPA